MAGRRPKLTFPALKRIDAWWKHRKWSAAVMARIVGVHRNTVYDAALRRRAYRECQ